MTALLEQRPMTESVRFAHAAAAIAVTRRGAQPSVPWRDEIDSFLQQQGKCGNDERCRPSGGRFNLYRIVRD